MLLIGSRDSKSHLTLRMLKERKNLDDASLSLSRVLCIAELSVLSLSLGFACAICLSFGWIWNDGILISISILLLWCEFLFGDIEIGSFQPLYDFLKISYRRRGFSVQRWSWVGQSCNKALLGEVAGWDWILGNVSKFLTLRACLVTGFSSFFFLYFFFWRNRWDKEDGLLERNPDKATIKVGDDLKYVGLAENLEAKKGEEIML